MAVAAFEVMALIIILRAARRDDVRAALLQHEDNGGRAEICGRARHRRGRGVEERHGSEVEGVRGKRRGGLREGVRLKSNEIYAD